MRGELHMSVQKRKTKSLRNRRHRRHRRLKIFLRFSGAAALLLLTYAWFTNWTNPLELLLPREAEPEEFITIEGSPQFSSSRENPDASKAAPSDTASDCLAKLEVLAQGSSRVRKVLNHTERYPQELLELLALNEEAVDFVLDYPKKKDADPAESIGTLTKGKIPVLLQWDEGWGYTLYGSSLLAVNGCGPTALSMVAAGLTGDDTLTPHQVAAYAEENGYYVEGSGSSWSLMTEGCRHFGVTGQELPLSENKISSELKAGHPIICSMRPGDFTTTGHFIVLTDVKDGKIEVHDPNSRARSKKLWDYETLEHQINNLWSFSQL